MRGSRSADGARTSLSVLGGVAEVRADAPAAVLMVDLSTQRVVYANIVAEQVAPDLPLPVSTEEWSRRADLRDLDGAPLSETEHPLSRVARFEPVAGQGVSAARSSDLGSRREPLWVVALPLDDAPNLTGHALVVLLPVRDRTALQERAVAAHRDGASGDALRSSAVLATGLSFTVADVDDPDCALAWVNPAFTAVTGYSFEETVGRNCRFLQGPGTDPEVRRELREAIAARESITATLLNYRKDGTAFWNQLALSPVHDASGRVTHIVGIQTDVSGRVAADAERDRALAAERAARAEAEKARQRLALLAEVTRQLSSTTDGEQAMHRLAGLVLPHLGDFAILAIVGDDAPDLSGTAVRLDTPGGHPPGASVSGRDLRDVACAHTDPALQPLLEAYCKVRLSHLTAAGRQVLNSMLIDGEPRHDAPAGQTGTSPTEALTPLMHGEAQDLLEQMELSSVATFPLRGRDRTVGLLTVGTGPDRTPLTQGQLDLGADIAIRAGLALDIARLYRQQRDLAAGLQRSLLTLTSPTTPHGLELAVRYAAAAEAAQVGGDFYDVFVQPGGATMLTIGDVMGHDTQAAAGMAQLRSIVRALGAAGDDGPAAVVASTDRVMSVLRLDTTATALVARWEDGELVWSNAGHPPPVVVAPDGTVGTLTSETTDLLLGVKADAPRQELRTPLARGTTVLLYTDGLVERRGQPLDRGLRRLQDELADLHAHELDLEMLVDALLLRLLPEHPADDVAVLALRVQTA
ncbi:PAS domain S-box-containing protein [Quadrisphaera granulorum]|uniref:PAS domain S-box-containing protein n=1 Tax=Quadrisphaera granulorum TaxID=317664 RepID=A0A316A4W2_9ACTN|nr:SpoIIE family protein phosphatase [Quadrisphaera granulorum]PWJ52735.1 PAS domain S-box-containing protein [Quadrisphaera granulorum]SZE97557.1 PAS domain S-box-containing protein [Quadrisphaera granulorum]